MSLSGKFILKFSSLCCFTCCIATIFIFFITNNAYCQSEGTRPIISTTLQQDSATIKLNNTGTGGDSMKNSEPGLMTDTGKNAADTSKRRQLEKSLGIKISKDALPSIVKATAEDSAVADMQQNLFHLYGNAQVNYEDLQLNAGKITYAQGKNIVSAVPYDERKDTSGASKQTFSQGKEKFSYDSLQYNFKSKRAIVRNVHSQYGEGYMYSEQVKRNPDQTIYGAHSIYTTCALDTPHFGIVADKIKVIPGKVIVSGPANLYIEGVPTPLWLPFAIFPVSEKQKSGFIIPTYTIEEQRGLGLLNGGYYLYMNDHVDFLTEANVFTKGSYGFSEVSNYSDIYHYKGTISLSYAYNKTGEPFESGSSISKDFMINWNHQSDPKAIPGQSFNASVELGSSSFYSNTSNISDQILQNQRQSNITYSKTWQGTPFGLTISALGSQNTLIKQTNVTLPDINFHVTQINPFQKKNSIGKHWYDKITASYTVEGLSKTTFYDSTFSFAHVLSNQYQMGMHHTVPISASYTIMRYINMSFSVNYDEYWVNQELRQNYNPLTNIIDTTTKQGFFASRDFNAGVNFSTRIYGMKMFKHGTLRGIRHVLTPTVGLTYHPDFGSAPFNYYYRTHLDTPILPSNYSYQTLYPNSVVGYPALGRAALVTFGVNNNLQIKVRSDKDTVTGFKNVTLIDALGATVSYNPAADSFKWSNIGLNFRTNIMDKINISSTASFNPYATDFNTGRELPQTMEDMGFGLAQFSSASFSLGSNFHSKPIGNGPNPSNSEEYGRVMRNAGYNNYSDFNIPWSVNFSYSFSANNTYNAISKRDTIILSQTLTLQGELQITQRWKLNVSSGYNFTFNQLTLTSIDVYRDLHCWAMHLQTIPFGPRKSFTFTLNVKSAILQDLKLTKRRDFRDSPN